MARGVHQITEAVVRQDGPTFGVMLPSFSSGGSRPTASNLREACEQIESLGFDSIWAIDHFLPTPVYGQSWLDPLLTLAFVAAHTHRVRIGTGVLVLPWRNPVLVAKEVATLQLLSDNRFILGVGVGWNPLEFQALQVPRSERGPRSDESIEVLRLLLSGASTSYAGPRVQFPEITIEPASAAPPQVWVGGGSQPAVEGSTDKGTRAPEAVMRRIAAADGWISPSTSPPALIAADWARIRSTARAAGRNPDSIVFAHMNSFHLVDTQDRHQAWQEQEQAYGRYLGRQRSWEFAKAVYLLGSLDDVVASIKERVALGVRYFLLGPVTADPPQLSQQLQLLASKIIPAI
jgi:probable F420-dependent oxidoreductase